MGERRETNPNSTLRAERPIFRFERLEVNSLAKEFAIETIKLTKCFPKEAAFTASPQLQRAALSIASNIAEGSGRLRSAEQAHFTTVAYSSLMEAICQWEIAGELGWIAPEVASDIRNRAEELALKLSALHKAQRSPRGSKP